MNRILLLIVFVLQSYCAFSQTWWKVENEYGDVILLTIELNSEKNTFMAYTRKEALKDIAGSITFTLAKTAGKLKYPEIVFIDGTTRKKADTLLLTGTFTYFDKQFPFSGSVSGNNFKGVYTDKNRPRKLTGIKMPGDNPLADYSTIISSALNAGEKFVADPVWINSGNWQDFKNDLGELKSKIKDDYEMAAATTWLGKKLPFSPFEINRINPKTKPQDARKPTIRELNTKTLIFDVNSLPRTKSETDSIAGIIAAKGYSVIIVDLRGRNSIAPVAAVQLLNLVSNSEETAGFFLTRKWFQNKTTLPKGNEITTALKNLAETGTEDFYNQRGGFFSVSPVKKGFIGKVFLITDNKTSKTSEALAFLFKTEKRGTVAGRKTAGSAFLTAQIPINKQFSLTLPVARFYTSSGKSPDTQGIEPDVAISEGDPVQYVLKTFVK